MVVAVIIPDACIPEVVRGIIIGADGILDEIIVMDQVVVILVHSDDIFDSLLSTLAILDDLQLFYN